MSAHADSPEIKAEDLRDLSALADGSIDPTRRDAVEARIAASPELSALYAREARIVDVIHSARATDRAPDALRARIAAQRPTRPLPLAAASATAGAWRRLSPSPCSRSCSLSRAGRLAPRR